MCSRQIAKRWSSVFRTEVSAAQVVIALIDVKLARLTSNPTHLDSQIDVAGYAACLREVTNDSSRRLRIVPGPLGDVWPDARD